jgi:hypothetical protein
MGMNIAGRVEHVPNQTQLIGREKSSEIRNVIPELPANFALLESVYIRFGSANYLLTAYQNGFLPVFNPKNEG